MTVATTIGLWFAAGLIAQVVECKLLYGGPLRSWLSWELLPLVPLLLFQALFGPLCFGILLIHLWYARQGKIDARAKTLKEQSAADELYTVTYGAHGKPS